MNIGNLRLDLTRVALRYRRTKIVATVGPSSSDAAMLGDLVDAGVNIFRLNFSHGTHDGHAEVLRLIREVAEARKVHVAVLADLCGPKIRVGYFVGGSVELDHGNTVTVTVRKVMGEPGLIPSEYDALAEDAKVGDRIMLDDGKLELKVCAIAGTELTCEVIHGGTLKDRKGMNLPGVAVSAPSLTEKDRADALFAASLGVDYLALSFVRKASDVADLRALLAEHDTRIPIISKIEKPEAIACIGEILEISDGIMIARGDLGVEMPPEEVPIIQQELIRLAVQVNRPVIVATQMLESMCDNPRPTRAEVSDVAGAALAGADAVMLSGETAAGRYPREAVATMDRTLRLVEGYQWRHGQFGKLADDSPPLEDVARAGHARQHALSRAAALLSRDLKVHAVMVPTRSGRTARIAAGQRPSAPIVALTEDPALCRQLALFWGVTPRQVSSADLANPPKLAKRVALELDVATDGDFILLMWNPTRAHTPRDEALTVTVLEL